MYKFKRFNSDKICFSGVVHLFVTVPLVGYTLNISHYTPNFVFCFALQKKKIYSIYINKYVLHLSAPDKQIERSMCDSVMDP